MPSWGAVLCSMRKISLRDGRDALKYQALLNLAGGLPWFSDSCHACPLFLVGGSAPCARYQPGPLAALQLLAGLLLRVCACARAQNRGWIYPQLQSEAVAALSHRARPPSGSIGPQGLERSGSCRG